MLFVTVVSWFMRLYLIGKLYVHIIVSDHTWKLSSTPWNVARMTTQHFFLSVCFMVLDKMKVNKYNDVCLILIDLHFLKTA